MTSIFIEITCLAIAETEINNNADSTTSHQSPPPTAVITTPCCMTSISIYVNRQSCCLLMIHWHIFEVFKEDVTSVNEYTRWNADLMVVGQAQP